MMLYVILLLKLLFSISDPPGPPENPSVADVTSTSCQVSWEPPKFDGGSPITGYHVERRQTDSSRWVKVTKSLVSELTFKCDLIEGNEYEFRAFAENKVGPGPPCSPTKPAIVAKEPYGKIQSHVTFHFPNKKKIVSSFETKHQPLMDIECSISVCILKEFHSESRVISHYTQ